MVADRRTPFHNRIFPSTTFNISDKSAQRKRMEPESLMAFYYLFRSQVEKFQDQMGNELVFDVSVVFERVLFTKRTPHLHQSILCLVKHSSFPLNDKLKPTKISTVPPQSYHDLARCRNLVGRRYSTRRTIHCWGNNASAMSTSSFGRRPGRRPSDTASLCLLRRESGTFEWIRSFILILVSYWVYHLSLDSPSIFVNCFPSFFSGFAPFTCWHLVSSREMISLVYDLPLEESFMYFSPRQWFFFLFLFFLL